MGDRTPRQPEACQRNSILKLFPLKCAFSHMISRLGIRGEAHPPPKVNLNYGFYTLMSLRSWIQGWVFILYQL